MVFTIHPKRERTEEPDEFYLCECGHMDTMHDVYTSLGHEEPKDTKCFSCQCPKYIFQLKTTLSDMLNVLTQRHKTWSIKKENWDKDIDKEIGT